jgi:hypothetical protein
MPAAPTPVSPSTTATLDGAAAIDSLDYWQAAVGLTYVLVEVDALPRVLIRSGTDGLAPWGGGRGGIDGTDPEDNSATSGIVVIEPGGGSFCRTPAGCRQLYRHEVGHALGFLGHSDAGLMRSGTDVLSDRELQMMRALYSLPFGARVEPDGSWRVGRTGVSGTLDDRQAALDIIAWNMTALGGASYRSTEMICRWELPVRVYLVP